MNEQSIIEGTKEWSEQNRVCMDGDVDGAMNDGASDERVMVL